MIGDTDTNNIAVVPALMGSVESKVCFHHSDKIPYAWLLVNPWSHTTLAPLLKWVNFVVLNYSSVCFFEGIFCIKKKKKGVFSVPKKNANKGKLLLWLRDIYEDFL